MGFRASSQQEDLFDLVQYETFAPYHLTKKGIFVRSGQGPGKTAATAVCAAFRLFQAKNAELVVTSPTARQCQEVWVNEFRKRLEYGHPGLKQRLKIGNRKILVNGKASWSIKTATATREENAQGYHNKNLTVIADEASGIGRGIWRVFKGTLTEPGNLLIGIGNPNDRDTEFFDAFNKDAHLYHTLAWSAEDSPNVDPDQIRKMEEEYGRDSDVFRVRVLGEFPIEAPNVVIRYEDLAFACQSTVFTEFFQRETPAEKGRTTRQIGIDLARFGSDESVIIPRMNSAMIGMRKFSKREPVEVLENAMAWQRDLGWPDNGTTYCVDAGGMGQSAMATLYRNKKHVYEFNSNGTAFDTRQFANCATEAYFILRNLTRNRAIHLKNDQQMFSQCVQRQYFYNKDNKFELESKDDFLKRVSLEEYTSPDRADALTLAFYPYASGKASIIPIQMRA